MFSYFHSITYIHLNIWKKMRKNKHSYSHFSLHVKMSIFSVQFSHSVMSDSLRLHEPQHSRPPCPSPTPGAYSNSCPLSWLGHPTISSSVVPFSACLQSFPASGFFQWVSTSHQVAKILEFQLQHQSFQWIFRTDFLWDWLVWSILIYQIDYGFP